MAIQEILTVAFEVTFVGSALLFVGLFVIGLIDRVRFQASVVIKSDFDLMVDEVLKEMLGEDWEPEQPSIPLYDLDDVFAPINPLEDIEALRLMAKEAGIKNASRMKLETLRVKLGIA